MKATIDAFRDRANRRTRMQNCHEGFPDAKAGHQKPTSSQEPIHRVNNSLAVLPKDCHQLFDLLVAVLGTATLDRLADAGSDVLL